MSVRKVSAEIVAPLPLRPPSGPTSHQQPSASSLHPAATSAAAAALLTVSLKDKVRSFLDRSSSENTRQAYQRTIHAFHRFAGRRHLLSITEREVLAWRDALLGAGQSEATVVTKLHILRAFYHHLQKFFPDLIPANPADASQVPPPKAPDVLKGRALSKKEIRHLLAGPDRSTAIGARDYALLQLMVRMALRASEAGSIKRSSIAWDDEGACWTLTLKIKGGRKQKWPLPIEVREAITSYLQLDDKRRQVWAENRAGEQFLFQPSRNHRTKRYNRGLSRQMIWEVVKKWGKFTGLGRLSPHDLRRTAITRALSQGFSYREVQMLSKHKDPKMVMRYDHERENLKLNPADKLNFED